MTSKRPHASILALAARWAAPLAVLLAASCAAEEPTVLVNEFMASNATTIMDPDSESYSDWIELYNPGDFAVSMDGFFLTDDIYNSTKHAISPALEIEPGGFLLFWADSDPELGPNHLTFKLDSEGEDIGLYYYNGESTVLMDALQYGAQQPDVSMARQPDGSENWVSTDNPTPCASNNQ